MQERTIARDFRWFYPRLFYWKFSLLAFSQQARRALNITHINTENNLSILLCRIYNNKTNIQDKNSKGLMQPQHTMKKQLTSIKVTWIFPGVSLL